MGRLAALLHGIVALAAGAPVIAFMLDPQRRRSRGATAAPFIRVASLDALPSGRPVRVPVFAPRRDSFIQYPRARIGEVWLLRGGVANRSAGRGGDPAGQGGTGADGNDPGGNGADGATRNATGADGPPLVRAWQTLCPHLGCGIDYAPLRRQFACPCHTSAFAPDGSRLFGPSPRDMDALDVRITNAEGRPWVEVQYRQFRTGVADRVVV